MKSLFPLRYRRVLWGTCNCEGTLQPGASCTMNVTFTPTSGGTRSGGVLIKDNALGSPQKLLLSGTGSGTVSIILSLSPPFARLRERYGGLEQQPPDSDGDQYRHGGGELRNSFRLYHRGRGPKRLRGAAVLWHQPGTELELYGSGDLHTPGERGADGVLWDPPGGGQCRDTGERYGHVEAG